MQVEVFPTVAALPVLERFEGYQTVAIDVLRATTTIVTALAAGATYVVPTLAPQEALEAAGRVAGSRLGGERNSVLIPGFDFGNSPQEYTPDRVAGRSIFFTTTNGTRAIHALAPLGPVLIASLVNVGAVVCRLRKAGKPVLILCAGMEDELSLEDSVCAGALADGLGEEITLNDFGSMARSLFRNHKDNLVNLLQTARHGKSLIDLGAAGDLEICARLNTIDLAPVYSDGAIQV